MIDWRLRRQLDKAARRLRHGQFVRQTTFLWLLFASLGGLLVLAQRRAGWTAPGGYMTLLGGAAAAWGILAVWQWYRTRDESYYRYVARCVEAQFPDLSAGLLAALDIPVAGPGRRLGYLQDRVLNQALSHAYHHGWQQVVSSSRLARLHLGHAASLAMLAAAAYAVAGETAGGPGGGAGTEAAFVRDGKFDVSVEPGNTEIERGTSLLVMARFRGPLPPEARLVFTSDAGGGSAAAEDHAGEVADAAGERRSGTVKMAKALDDPLFGASVPHVTQPLEYHVEYAGQRTETFRVELFEYPRLVKADALLVFPAYTAQSEKLVQDVRHVSAVLGTRVTLRCRCNKPVALAQLLEKDGTSLQLDVTDPVACEYEVSFTLDRTRRAELKLVDPQGRASKDRVEFVFTALPNTPPELKLAAPGRDVDVSPLEELDLRAKAFDDFGIKRTGVSFSVAGGEEREVVLATEVAGKQRIDIGQVLALESLEAQPDQLLAYYFWAEDTGPDGQTRRVASDMYFAEVQPFDEIFRQGQQPAGGESPGQGAGGAAGQAENLAQLQKEVMNATWKLIRRETAEPPSPEFAPDIKLVHDSQTSALEQATQLTERIQDSRSVQHVQDVLRHMTTAVEQLTQARDQHAIRALRPALEAEQAAYQALLRLRAREHQVIRSQQRGSGGGGASSRSQQQLDQLQLRDQENRYETERTAQQQESEAERETRQVLSRLRELARRQDDLNERIKELNAELQQAETEEKREELRQRLKRLQEEQERILRDTDELQARLDQPQNAERMAESREQLADARERVLQSSEALRDGQIPQAVSAGARAQEEFEQMREELRKQTSSHFLREMRELQQQARALDESEQAIAGDLERLTNPVERTRSLRDAGDRERIAEEIGKQQQRIAELFDRLRRTIEEAEQPQPLLANQLYDATRQAQQRDPGRGLDTTRQLLRRGFDEQAREQEQPVGQAITELREGVDRAADSILGDESEALRRAQDQLRDLARGVEQELRAQGVDTAEGGPDAGSRELRGRNGERPDDAATGQAERGKPTPSENAAGEPVPEEGRKRGEEAGRSGETGPPSSQRRSPDAGRPSGRSPDGQKEESQEPGEPGQGQPGKGEQAEGQQGKGQQGKGQEGKGQEGKGQASGPGEGAGEPGAASPAQASGTGGEAAGRPPGQQRSAANRPGRGGEGSREERGEGGADLAGGFEQLSGMGGPNGPRDAGGPFAGGNFREWSDRLRDVEEMLSDPALSADAARIRERARAIRAEAQRHSQPPNWELVKLQVAEPLAELLQRVSQELLKHAGGDSLVPLDRDPVPPEFSEQVRRYFEQLGTGK